MRHLYQCSSDQLSQNLKIWLRDATKKFILNIHMELDMFPILQIFKVIALKLIIQKTTQIHIDRKSRANALLTISLHHHIVGGDLIIQLQYNWWRVIASAKHACNKKPAGHHNAPPRPA